MFQTIFDFFLSHLFYLCLKFEQNKNFENLSKTSIIPLFYSPCITHNILSKVFKVFVTSRNPKYLRGLWEIGIFYK